jgi:hypothetical protein
METKRLENAIHGAIFNKNVKGIKKVKDFYKDATADIDISGLRINVVNEQIEVFKWILEHPDYDFISLFEGYFAQFYTNEELFSYFKVYYEDINFILKRYNEKKFIIKYSDLE